MKAPSGMLLRALRAICGLVDGPSEWLVEVEPRMLSEGFVKLWSDPCVYMLPPKKFCVKKDLRELDSSAGKALWRRSSRH